jgi:hypothetical protein
MFTLLCTLFMGLNIIGLVTFLVYFIINALPLICGQSCASHIRFWTDSACFELDSQHTSIL